VAARLAFGRCFKHSRIEGGRCSRHWRHFRLISSFIYGFLFVLGLVLAVRLWGRACGRWPPRRRRTRPHTRLIFQVMWTATGASGSGIRFRAFGHAALEGLISGHLILARRGLAPVRRGTCDRRLSIVPLGRRRQPDWGPVRASRRPQPLPRPHDLRRLRPPQQPSWKSRLRSGRASSKVSVAHHCVDDGEQSTHAGYEATSWL